MVAVSSEILSSQTREPPGLDSTIWQCKQPVHSFSLTQLRQTIARRRIIFLMPESFHPNSDQQLIQMWLDLIWLVE